MLRKLMLRRKNVFLIKKTRIEKRQCIRQIVVLIIVYLYVLLKHTITFSEQFRLDKIVFRERRFSTKLPWGNLKAEIFFIAEF